MIRLMVVCALFMVAAAVATGCASQSSSQPLSAAVAMGLKTTPVAPSELAQAQAHYKMLKNKWATTPPPAKVN